jgi:hypothetical protein
MLFNRNQIVNCEDWRIFFEFNVKLDLPEKKKDFHKCDFRIILNWQAAKVKW